MLPQARKYWSNRCIVDILPQTAKTILRRLLMIDVREVCENQQGTYNRQCYTDDGEYKPGCCHSTTPNRAASQDQYDDHYNRKRKSTDGKNGRDNKHDAQDKSGNCKASTLVRRRRRYVIWNLCSWRWIISRLLKLGWRLWLGRSITWLWWWRRLIFLQFRILRIAFIR